MEYVPSWSLATVIGMPAAGCRWRQTRPEVRTRPLIITAEISANILTSLFYANQNKDKW